MLFVHRLIASGVLGGPTWITPTDIPAAAAVALKQLYDLTNGAGWTTKTNWGKTATAANWYGITVAGGKVTVINLPNNNLVGNISTFAINAFATLDGFVVNTNALLVGNLSSWVWPTTIRNIYLYSTGVSGPITTWVIRATVARLYIHSTTLSGCPDVSAAANIILWEYQNCGLSQAHVNAVLLAIATRFSAGGFTYATPAINISGTNAAPSGAYADEDPPSTGLGACFEICTDPEATGYNTWTATVTGSGPYP